MTRPSRRRRSLRIGTALALLVASLALGGPAGAQPTDPPTPVAGYGDEAPEAGDGPSDAPTAPPGDVTSLDPTDTASPTDSSSPTASPTDTPTPSPTPDAPTPTPKAPQPPTASIPVPAKSTSPPPLYVTIDFDDGTADQFQTGALLRDRNLAGVYYVNSGRIGLTSSYLSIEQIRALQAAGHEIGGHTVFHLHLPEQSIAEQRRQICTDRNQLLAQGLRVTDLAFPFGDFTAATQDVVRNCGYNSVRTSEGDSGGPDQVLPANPYQLKALSSLGSTTTTRQITDAITKAQKQGGIFQVVFHRICTAAPCRSNAIRIAVFTQVLDWLVAQRAAGRLQVRTVAQVIGGPVRPPVAAPPPTATLAVPDASFEQGESVPGVPTCWEHTVSSDNNIAEWSRTHDAHTGSWAEHVNAPRIVGGVGLVVAQDEGSCAAPVTVGDRYTYGVWYKSSAPVQLVSYRRLAAGGYLSFGLSAAFAPSPGGWAYATVTTRPMPAGSTGVSIGVAIKQAGQYTFDDFTVADSGPLPPKPTSRAAAQIRDESTPTVAPVAIPSVAAVAPVAAATTRSWSGAFWIFAAMLLLALALALIDWRLARLRRGRREER